MRKILNRGAKRRLRRKQQSARRSRTRSLIRGMEPLEDRRLLAASADGNWGMLLNGPAAPVTFQVQRDFSIPFGVDGAIAVAANWTQSTSVTLTIDLDINGGAPDFTLTQLNAVAGGVAGPHPDVEGKFETKVVPVGLASETLNSAIWLIPTGDNVMGRDVRVTITGGITTDFLAWTGTYHDVEQGDGAVGGAGPVGSAVSLDFAGTIGFTSVTIPTVGKDNPTLDAVMALNRTGFTLKNLEPDPLSNDPGVLIPAGAPQLELVLPVAPAFGFPSKADAEWTPSTGNMFRGGSSTDDWDETGSTVMDWAFQPSGAAGFTHVAVEINTDGTPGNDPLFVFDFGDADDKTAGTGTGDYQTTLANKGPFHAPKGAMLGDYRDAESDAKILAGTALGDDTDAGIPSQLAPFPVAADDEDGVSKFATNGAVVGGNTFISQWMGTNIGSVDIEVNLETDAKTKLEIPAYVTGYIDWNRDGDFDDTGELVIAGAQVTKSGTDTYKFNIPMSADVVEGMSIMRVRLSHATMGDKQTLAPGGHASSGEVEDHAINLEHGSEIHGIKFEDLDGDGVRDLNEPPLPGVLISLQGPGGGGTSTKIIDFDAKRRRRQCRVWPSASPRTATRLPRPRTITTLAIHLAIPPARLTPRAPVCKLPIPLSSLESTAATSTSKSTISRRRPC